MCRHGLRGFDAAYSFGSYEGVLREWIHLYKYGRVKTMQRPLEELLAAALPREEAAQAGLSNTGRRVNVATAFAVRRGQALTGKRLLLIDDVLTTGSTAAACARVLRRAGAARIVLLTVARADRRIDFTPGHLDSTPWSGD